MIHLKLLSENSQSIRFAIYDTNIYVGGITVYPVDSQTAVYGILIRSACRRQGYGKAALLCLFAELKHRGFIWVRARIEAANTASLCLHRSLEFTQTGTEMDGKILVFEHALIFPDFPGEI